MTRVRWYSVVALGLAVLTTAVALPGVANARSKKPKAHAAIVGGASAPTGTWPWLAFIDDNLGSEGDYNCTGTVIAPNLVLTAAHCGEDPPSGVIDNVNNFTVVTGTLDKTNTSLGQVSGVTEIIPHATEVETGGADGTTIIGDAALLVLATPTTAPAITLADSSDLSLVLPGTPAEIAGWGLMNGTDLTSHPDVLQYASTVVADSAECLLDNPTFDAQAQVCAQDSVNESASTCGGDSGGPLMAQNDDSQWVEIGITSTSGPDCDPSYAQYFTRVDYIEPWAQSCITDLTACTATPAPTAPVATAAPTAPPAPAPAPVPAPVAAAVAAPGDGAYAGKSSQHSGRVHLTVTPGAVTDLTLKYNLNCRHHERGPLVQTYKRAVPLDLTDGVWGFSAAYRNSAGWRFSVTGAFSEAGVAAGRLTVLTRNAQCHSGAVSWSARPLTP